MKICKCVEIFDFSLMTWRQQMLVFYVVVMRLYYTLTTHDSKPTLSNFKRKNKTFLFTL